MNSMVMMLSGIGCFAVGLIGLILSIVQGRSAKKAIVEKLEKEY